MARENPNYSGKGFPDAPFFDGGKTKELRTWIIQLRNKLAAQPNGYLDDEECLQYTVNHISGSTLNLIHSYVSENTGRIRLDTLNALLEVLHQTFDESDRTSMANCEIRKLRLKIWAFSAYLAQFGRIMGDLSWNEKA